MPNKALERVTVDTLRTDLIGPLSKLVIDLTNSTERMSEAIRTGAMAHEHLEMNLKRARNAIKLLRSIYRKEVQDKIEDAIEGTYRWRMAEKRAAHRRRRPRD